MPQRQQRARPIERDNTPRLRPMRQEKHPNLVRYAKGEAPGRPPGSRNKVTRIVKEALLDSLEESGSDGKGKDGSVGYFVWLSRSEPVAYAALIARVLPMQLQVSGDVNHTGAVAQVRMTSKELEAKLKERGLPMPTLIEHDPDEFLDVESGGTRDEED